MHAVRKNAKTANLRNHTAKTSTFMFMRKNKDPLQNYENSENFMIYVNEKN